MKLDKVRFYTWYWGNYCWAKPNEKLQPGFELYVEEKHGWQHSEEYKAGKEAPYYDQSSLSEHYETIVGLTYIRNQIKKLEKEKTCQENT